MSNTPSDQDKNRDNLNDDDLRALFAASAQEPPADVDSNILEYAKSAQTETINPNRESFLQRYAPLFGTAAVVVFAITLTPLLMNTANINTPNMTPDVVSSDVVTSDSGTADIATTDLATNNQVSAQKTRTNQSVGATASTNATVSESLNIGSTDETSSSSLASAPEADVHVLSSTDSAVDTLSTETSVAAKRTITLQPSAERMPAAAPNTTAELNIDSDTTEDMAGLSPTKTSKQAASNPLFRQNAKRWAIEITRLFKDNKLTQAKEELKLFRQKHPETANEELLPKELQEIELDVD